MKKMLKYLMLTALVPALFLCGSIFSDKKMLRDDIIRLHIVANSDEKVDQQRKLAVRDAVNVYLHKALSGTKNAQEAVNCLESELNNIKMTAINALEASGSKDEVTVTLKNEPFDTRNYDTFLLPAGVYRSLRINIGDAEGKNWWCVVFPSLCLPASAGGFTDNAVSCGLSEGLVDTITDREDFKVRFFLLECIGKLENLFADQ